MSNVVKPADRYAGLDTRFWADIVHMAEVNKAINLGMGMPDFNAQPQSIMDAMCDVLVDGHYSLHQYTKSSGHPRLVKVLAKLYSHLLNNEVKDDNILITLGAYQAIHCALYGLINHGDEVIIIDPAYDAYATITRAAGGVPVHTALKRTDTYRNENNNDITGADALMPGMYERTVTIGSLGKAFNVTGWRCGWAITGHPGIRHALSLAHVVSVYCCPTPIQEAAARVFEIELDKLQLNHVDCMYWTQLCALMGKKRTLMYDMLTDMGLKPMMPEGSYYMVADCQALIDRLDLTAYYDKRGKTFEFVRWLSARGVQAVPLTVFYSTDNKQLGEGITNELGANKGFYLGR
ncbi:unnamed protein product [Medioppia subpectinata]|uniref:kynurenine--oxoglutarate transaminase n=1 Tax=Medioppia subpectinata TaxID=1979941 RepID=A0A7R9PU31_9ACAR|nr:unnamed protein product [Medioppia subpectinata]CAG2100359.1 unnamed protein product [Medioppia subpectinata]